MRGTENQIFLGGLVVMAVGLPSLVQSVVGAFSHWSARTEGAEAESRFPTAMSPSGWTSRDHSGETSLLSITYLWGV